MPNQPTGPKRRRFRRPRIAPSGYRRGRPRPVGGSRQKNQAGQGRGFFARPDKLAGPGDGDAAGPADPIGAGQDRHFPPRAIIFLEGEEARSIFQVIEGAVMLYRLLPDGRRQVIELLSPGGLFGCVPQPVRDCCAETLVATRCLEIDRDAVNRSADVASQIGRQLALQLGSLHEHVMRLGRKSALERIASFLMDYVPDRGRQPCPGPRTYNDAALFELTLTRQEIADYLGLTIETVSRLLTNLKRGDVVRMNGLEEIVVTDVCRLCRLTGTHLTRGPRCSARGEPG